METESLVQSLRDVRASLRDSEALIARETARFKELNKTVTVLRRKLDNAYKKKLVKPKTENLDEEATRQIIQKYDSTSESLLKIANSLDIEKMKSNLKEINEFVEEYGTKEYMDKIRDESMRIKKLEERVSRAQSKLEDINQRNNNNNNNGKNCNYMPHKSDRSLDDSDSDGNSEVFTNLSTSLFMEDLSAMGFDTDFICKEDVGSRFSEKKVNSFFGAVNGYINEKTDVETLLYMMRNGVKEMEDGDMPVLNKIFRLVSCNPAGKNRLLAEIIDITSKLSYEEFRKLRKLGTLKLFYGYIRQFM